MDRLAHNLAYTTHYTYEEATSLVQSYYAVTGELPSEDMYLEEIEGTIYMARLGLTKKTLSLETILGIGLNQILEGGKRMSICMSCPYGVMREQRMRYKSGVEGHRTALYCKKYRKFINRQTKTPCLAKAKK